MENMRWVPCGESAGTTARVDHLIEGHDYKFRVKGYYYLFLFTIRVIRILMLITFTNHYWYDIIAVNRQGESQPLTGTSAVTAKDPFSKPDKPGEF